jgi:Ser/Thr protein kinase RdoA (MazF antagonist)
MNRESTVDTTGIGAGDGDGDGDGDATAAARDLSHPFTALIPDRILDAVDAAGWRGDGRLLGLNSYENRVYQLWLEDGDTVVVKFYRPQRWSDEQILEEHRYTRELADLEIPVVAPLAAPSSAADGADPAATLHHQAGFRLAVYPRQGGRAPELEDPATLEWVGRFIGRIHAVGAVRPFASRPPIDPQTFGFEPRQWLLASGLVPTDLRPAWTAVVDQALQAVSAAWERAGTLRTLRLHGDCHPGNILWADDGPHFVDFDDARNGPAIQDLWMLLSGDGPAMARQLSDVLAGYEDFMEFDRRELGLIEPLRTLRLIHYSAWIASRWQDPAFPAAFPWFGTARYWQDRILELREQLGAMSEPLLHV